MLRGPFDKFRGACPAGLSERFEARGTVDAANPSSKENPL